jgi:hypothetical protein|nr:MAG TPA_asm: hypothetical protein [Bacteriophage sp.]
MYKPLDIYDDMPSDMKRYISNFGWHFNKKAYDYATKLMYKVNENTKEKENIKAYTKEEVDALLSKYGVNLRNKILHDYVFAATMCKADYLGSSIENERQLAMYVKDTIDDSDASDETTFRRWVATMIGNGTPIDWYEIC